MNNEKRFGILEKGYKIKLEQYQLLSDAPADVFDWRDYSGGKDQIVAGIMTIASSNIPEYRVSGFIVPVGVDPLLYNAGRKIDVKPGALVVRAGVHMGKDMFTPLVVGKDASNYFLRYYAPSGGTWETRVAASAPVADYATINDFLNANVGKVLSNLYVFVGNQETDLPFTKTPVELAEEVYQGFETTLIKADAGILFLSLPGEPTGNGLVLVNSAIVNDDEQMYDFTGNKAKWQYGTVLYYNDGTVQLGTVFVEVGNGPFDVYGVSTYYRAVAVNLNDSIV